MKLGQRHCKIERQRLRHWSTHFLEIKSQNCYRKNYKGLKSKVLPLLNKSADSISKINEISKFKHEIPLSSIDPLE